MHLFFSNSMEKIQNYTDGNPFVTTVFPRGEQLWVSEFVRCHIQYTSPYSTVRLHDIAWCLAHPAAIPHFFASSFLLALEQPGLLDQRSTQQDVLACPDHRAGCSSRAKSGCIDPPRPPCCFSSVSSTLGRMFVQE